MFTFNIRCTERMDIKQNASVSRKVTKTFKTALHSRAF